MKKMVPFCIATKVKGDKPVLRFISHSRNDKNLETRKLHIFITKR